MNDPAPEAVQRLQTEPNIWLTSVRPDGRPHLVPVWFAWLGGKLYICTDPRSVKARNIGANPHVALSLENGSHAVICEGTAAALVPPWPPEVAAAFKEKYDWDITTDEQYAELLEVIPDKWLAW